MHYSQCSDFELLSRLVGRRAASRLYRGALRPIFSLPPDHSTAHRKLAAAWELMQRLIVEELKEGPVLASPMVVRDYLRLLYAGREYESFAALFLDNQNRLLTGEELFRGTLTQTSVYPREIVKRSLQLNAAAVIFSHNHPSGVTEPSRADEHLTQSLKTALALVDVQVLDHIVISGDKATSFAERGLL